MSNFHYDCVIATEWGLFTDFTDGFFDMGTVLEVFHTGRILHWTSDLLRIAQK